MSNGVIDSIEGARKATGKTIRKGWHSFKYINSTKNNKSIDILGCTFYEFKLYLESKFENWMTYDNYGLYNGSYNFGWDIDHIIPISNASNIEEIYKLNHYTNLQPLDSKINRDIKKNKQFYKDTTF